MLRRLGKGRAVRIDVWWTESRLVPELAKAELRSHRADLERQFQPRADLSTDYQPLEFLTGDLPTNLRDWNCRWMSVRGREGVRYLGAEPAHLALVGMCAGWKYPPAG